MALWTFSLKSLPLQADLPTEGTNLKKSIETMIVVLFICALPAIFATGVIQYQNVLRLVDAQHWVKLTNEALLELRTTLSLVNDAERGVEGSGPAASEGGPEVFDSAVSRTPEHLQRLRTLTSGDLREQRKLDALEPWIASLLASRRNVASTRKGNTFAAASQSIPRGTDKQLATDIQETLSAMEVDQQMMLRQKNAAAEASARRVIFIATLGSGLALGIVTLAALLIHYFIKDRKRAEVAQAISTRLVQSMADGVCLSDEYGTILYSNPASDAMFGYKPGELVGKQLTRPSNTSLPEESDRIVHEINDQLKWRGAWRGEFATFKKDGTPFTCYARLSPLEVSGKLYWISVQEERGLAEKRVAPGTNDPKMALTGIGA